MATLINDFKNNDATFYGCENKMSSKKCKVLRIAFGS